MVIHERKEEALASADHDRVARGRGIAGVCAGVRTRTIHLHDFLAGAKLKNLSRFIATSALVIAAAGCASAPSPLNRIAVAYATITDAKGDPRGTVELWQDTDNIVHVDAQLISLPSGPHGIHFHAAGKCDGTEATPFTSAGAHFNPLGRQHGLDNPAGPHAGDAPNFTASANGTAHVSFTTDRVSLTAGSTSLFDSDGSAIVIHAAADDQTSQPSGNSGARIACGVVKQTR
jgi:Cu-Zn family superoxide dismutase